MNQQIYMRNVINGALTPVGEEIGIITAPGTWWFDLKDPNSKIAVVGDYDERCIYPLVYSRNSKLTGGIRIDSELYNNLTSCMVSVSVSPHPENGLPKFPLKLVTVSEVGHAAYPLDFVDIKIKEPGQKKQIDAVYLVIKKNTLNCASDNLSAFLSKDDAYEEALALTRSDKDSKFLYKVQEVSLL